VHVHRVAGAGDFDHEPANPRFISTPGRDACASSQLRNFDIGGGRGCIALRSIKRRSAQRLRDGLRIQHGVNVRRIRNVVASRRQLLATGELRCGYRAARNIWGAGISTEPETNAGPSFCCWWMSAGGDYRVLLSSYQIAETRGRKAYPEIRAT